MTVLDTDSDTNFVYVDADAARIFTCALLRTHGVPDYDANIITECLVRADLRGVDTHGLMRLPGYLERIRRKLVNARPEVKVTRVSPAAAAIDGDNGLGFVVATRAMTEAVDIAASLGIGVAAARHSNHFGMAANYITQALAAGYAAFVFTNASRAMPPWGGRKALLGTSPLAVGAPGGREGPFLLDMSPTVAARGKIRQAYRRGEKIPEGFALDAEGRATTDPAKALQGVMLPIAGAKGSGLSMLMDIFGGVISGAAFAGDVGNQYEDFDRPQDVGHFFLAIKPDLFVSLENYRARMDLLAERIHGCPPAEGFSEVLIPGEPEAREEKRRLQTGIPYSRSELGELEREARNAGCPQLIWSDIPLRKI